MSSIFKNQTTAATQPHSNPLSNTPPDQRPFNGGATMLRTPSNPQPNGSRAHHRASGEFRHRGPVGLNGNGPVPVPAGLHGQFSNGHSRNGPGGVAMQPFDLARSPPNAANKSKSPVELLYIILPPANQSLLPLDTKHVPCKFFKQGACQAGQACPFLHSTDTMIDTAPCKYFTKVWPFVPFIRFSDVTLIL